MYWSVMDFGLITLGGVLAGLVGALMGLGGGIVAVPFLNLVLGIPMHQAAAAGLVSTLTVSCSAAGRYLRFGGLVDIDRALQIELAAATGGLAGGYLAGWLLGPHLQILFAFALVLGCVQIFRSMGEQPQVASAKIGPSGPRSALAFVLSFLAGGLAGVLGIGGGMLLVPILHLLLRLDFKSATATSNFMMGLTAIPALSGFIARGDLLLGIAVPLAGGVCLGASVGACLLRPARAAWLKIGFCVLLALTAVRIFLAGIQVW